jgi:hypothetical protein
MNEKKAKSLRKMVRAWANAQKDKIPERSIAVGKVTNKKVVDPEDPEKTITEQRVTLINSRQSLRGVYRKLKKELRA